MSFEMPLEMGKIREFARALQSQNPAFAVGTPVIPPTFLTTVRSWEPPDQHPAVGLDLDPARLLHGEEEFVFHGPPPRAGQTLCVTGRLGEQFEKQGKRGGTMRFVKVIREYRDTTGALVAEQRTTAIQTAVPPEER